LGQLKTKLRETISSAAMPTPVTQLHGELAPELLPDSDASVPCCDFQRVDFETHVGKRSSDPRRVQMRTGCGSAGAVRLSVSVTKTFETETPRVGGPLPPECNLRETTRFPRWRSKTKAQKLHEIRDCDPRWLRR
jgi:hypothetical protein